MTDQSRPPHHDQNYLARREAQERAAADRAPDPAARYVHLTLAERYAERLRATMPVAG